MQHLFLWHFYVYFFISLFLRKDIIVNNFEQILQIEVESSVFGYLKKNKNIEVSILRYQEA